MAAPAGGKSPDWVYYILVVSVWGALLLTVYSGIEYVRRANIGKKEQDAILGTNAARLFGIGI